MSVIRFNTDEVFTVDSSEYEILANAITAIKGVNGAVVEIGTRRGGSAKIIIDSLVQNQDTNRSMFCIDPYGNIDYPCSNMSVSTHMPGISVVGDPKSTEIVNPNIKLDYDNTMRNRIIPSLYYYAYAAGLDFTFFCLEDTEFFNRYADGVPVYNEVKSLENTYASVFFDGPHTNDAILLETEFFLPRVAKGSVFIYDDLWHYSHDEVIEKILFKNDFKILEKGNVKASYVKL